MKLIKHTLSNKQSLYYQQDDTYTVHYFGTYHALPLLKENTPSLTLLRRLMRQYNENLPTKQQFQLALTEQYGMDWNVDIDVEYQLLFINLYSQAIYGSIVGQENLDGDLFKNVFFNLLYPVTMTKNLTRNVHNLFTQEKKQYLEIFDDIDTDVSRFVSRQLYRMLGEDHYGAFDLLGEKVKVKQLKIKDIQSAHNFILSYPMDFYYYGNLPLTKVLFFINHYLASLPVPTHDRPKRQSGLIQPGNFESKTIHHTFHQTHYRLMLTTAVPRLSSYSEAFKLLNEMLGASSESLLFKIVREEEGLCYSIRSSFNYDHSVFIISMGLDKDKVPLAQKRIKDIISMLQTGNFELHWFDKIKQTLINEITIEMDHPNTRHNILLNNYINDNFTSPEDIIQKIKAVSKIDIITVAQMLKPLKELIVLGKK